MEYKITDNGGFTTIEISGRLIEKSQAESLIKEYEQLLNGEPKNILISLADLEYVNSSGLNLLIGMFTQARNAGGELVIGGISPKVKKLMVMTKLDSVFKIYESVEEATENF